MSKYHMKNYDKPEGETSPNQNLYRHAEDIRRRRFDEGKSVSTDAYLNKIIEEIDIRVRITAQEVFLIGELLCEANEIIKTVPGINFEDWVNNNCHFKYHTARNFMNVYTVCLGYIEELHNIKPSILYKVCNKNFPKELQHYLFSQEDPSKPKIIENMKIGKLKELCNIYDKNGIDAIRDKLSGISESAITLEQINYACSRANEAVAKLKKIKDSLFDKEKDPDILFTSEINLFKRSDEIRGRILDTFNECIMMLENACKDAQDFKIDLAQDGTPTESNGKASHTDAEAKNATPTEDAQGSQSQD